MAWPEVDLQLPSPEIEVKDDRLAAKGVRVILKRDDLIHTHMPGNKWRKLKYNLQEAQRTGHDTLLTFGGAYSNHIRAVAAAGCYFGFKTVGVIRGEQHLPLNDTLAFATSCGMRLSYLDRGTYRNKHDPSVADALRERFGRFYLLPEGGSNALAVRGCAELAAEIETDFDVICCACGTGGTIAGIAGSLRAGQRTIGFPVLKGAHFLYEDIARLQREGLGKVSDNWTLALDFHFGGFARKTRNLDEFIQDFRGRHGVELDWVYVAKMLYGVFVLVERRDFKPGTTIVGVVTG
ncbi:1-aminocyclopropane-1-carboxylate deaminase/D-cysteine desulfhydrase [Saccharopolyspora erythraea]|uniref:1-aminocyclopropane-1-carboxylate deaminase/D-cysteine desulfhydrase n=1 Tax=Saccharopolyspora erythraea TaxID=1836 RepID=UPI001BA77179|nr:pyridoxal-phosphate dependent enzyme [Saccharopolyspora erythraea]QUH01525.1 1-aminocyclopropane-1-carboxylate deaminase/D-cysteine desulfhydrase [Saccharopolyspora erythraea]